MLRSLTLSVLGGCAVLALAACGASSRGAEEGVGFGPSPRLPVPHKSLLPTVNIAPAKGWPPGAGPVAPDGFRVTALARGLDHPRWLYQLPNGDVLVAETNGPAKPAKGVRGWIEKLVMRNAGAKVPSAERITLLRDADGDGVAEVRTAFITGLHSPFGMTLVGDSLYVADTDALLRFAYTEGETAITAAPAKLTDLPGGPIDHHWTKNVVASPDGSRLYVSVGSNSNVGENGIAAEAGRAAIWVVDPTTGAKRIYAQGLRNPNGMDFQPQTGALWVTVNERDELGDNLVPDYMTAVREGGFYGWPYSYWGQHVDTRVKPQRPDLVAKAIAPDYALGAHTASLGLAFHDDVAFPAVYSGGVFIGQHGSWNRSQPAGYKVIFIPFRDGQPAGPPRDFLTGFLSADGDALGRPVGVIEARDGALLVADDVGDVVWRVALADQVHPAPAAAAAP